MLCREGLHPSKCLVQPRSIRMIQDVGFRLSGSCDVIFPKQFVAEPSRTIERINEALAVQHVGVRLWLCHTGSTKHQSTCDEPLQQGFLPDQRREIEWRRDHGSVERASKRPYL